MKMRTQTDLDSKLTPTNYLLSWTSASVSSQVNWGQTKVALGSPRCY